MTREQPLFPWRARTFIMGIINVTPDSFSGDGIRDPDDAAELARRLKDQGADGIDIGGESTRPGYAAVLVQEELGRVIPAIEAVSAAVDMPISVDTSKAEVARQAVRAGASIVNDVSGLGDPEMPSVVATTGAGLVVVHNRDVRGLPNPMETVVSDLRALTEQAIECGVSPDALIVDPGFGFGKSWKENFAVIRRLEYLKELGLPILVGPSRKGMIGKVLGTGVDDRLEGTAALVVLCIAAGADCVRVHDVREMARVARMTDAIVRSTE